MTVKRKRAVDRIGHGTLRSPGRPPVLPRAARRPFWIAIAGGASSEAAALSAGSAQPVGTRWCRECGGLPPSHLSASAPMRSARYLSLAEREALAILRALGHGVREIARRLHRAPSTVSRALRRALTACLRTGRTLRVPRARSHGRGKSVVTADVLISERPAQIEDRAVPGHWEGDLILGLQSSAIGTLVERTTRFTLPHQLRQTLTWDHGAEMSQHAQLRLDAGLHVYFCDPHSPWQRATNENTNGLLRQYFPKGTDLSGLTAEELNAVAFTLNTRPRQALGWRTPAEALDVFLRSPSTTGVATTS